MHQHGEPLQGATRILGHIENGLEALGKRIQELRAHGADLVVVEARELSLEDLLYPLQRFPVLGVQVVVNRSNTEHQVSFNAARMMRSTAPS